MMERRKRKNDVQPYQRHRKGATMTGIDYSEYDRLPNPMDDPNAKIEYVLPRPMSITTTEQLRDIIAAKSDEQGLSMQELARESMVPVNAVAKLERTGEGSVHDAMNVLETLHIKPMALPPAIVEAALHAQSFGETSSGKSQ
jgi:hypothetical protein